AGNELLGAVKAVIRGRQFLSRSLRRRGFADVSPPPRQGTKIAHLHEVQFYSNEAGFLDTFSDFTAAVLQTGNPVIVVATESHRHSLLAKLQTRGLDISSAIEQGEYIALD